MDAKSVSSQLLKRLLAPSTDSPSLQPSCKRVSLHPCASSSAWPVLYCIQWPGPCFSPCIRAAAAATPMSLFSLHYSNRPQHPLTELDLVCFLFSSPRLKIKKRKAREKIFTESPSCFFSCETEQAQSDPCERHPRGIIPPHV